MFRPPRRVVAPALSAIVSAALSAIAVAPALAANQGVGVADILFSPGRVAVQPGESVTWTNPGTGNPHNVRFEDGALRSPSPPNSGPWTASRTFATDGTYRFYCEVHGGPGGSGMSGIVYVNATASLPPVAAFTVSPSPAQVGQAVSFNGAGSIATEGVDRYQWDLDGDGTFETDSGTTATTSRSYPAPQRLTVKVRVTDTRGATDETTRSLKINAAPTASFTTSPNPAQAGQIVGFNGAGSTDPDGFISKYEWDLDGDGTFETDSAATATTSRSYSGPGALTVKLRVTDSNGATGETTRSLQGQPLPAAARPRAAPAHPDTAPAAARPQAGEVQQAEGQAPRRLHPQALPQAEGRKAQGLHQEGHSQALAARPRTAAGSDPALSPVGRPAALHRDAA